MGLSMLPMPKNDFEIVVQENKESGGAKDVEMVDDANTWTEDKANIDQQTKEE